MNQRSDPPPDPPDGPAGPVRTDLPATGCAPSLEELYRYMDGALDDGRVAHVRSHLDACGGCGELYDVQAQFRRLIEVRCKTELPPDLADRVFGAIAELGLPPKRPR